MSEDGPRALAGAFDEARRAKRLSFSQVHLAVYDILGPETPTMETIRQLHRMADPMTVRLILVAALASVYGKALGALSPILEERRKRDLGLLMVGDSSSPWTTMPILAGAAA